MDAPNTRAESGGKVGVGVWCVAESIKKNARVLAVPNLYSPSNLLKGLSILGFTVGWLGNYGFFLILVGVLQDSVADPSRSTVQPHCLDGSWRALSEFHNIIHVVAH